MAMEMLMATKMESIKQQARILALEPAPAAIKETGVCADLLVDLSCQCFVHVILLTFAISLFFTGENGSDQTGSATGDDANGDATTGSAQSPGNAGSDVTGSATGDNSVDTTTTGTDAIGPGES